MITYIPLSMRSGHWTAKMQPYIARLAARAQRYEDGIIGRVDQDKRNAKVAEQIAKNGRDRRGRVIDPAWVLRAQ